jgi:Ca2+-binding EF-hand superfamily protein
MFKNIDKDNSGTITLDELKNGLAKHGTKLSDSEIQQLMEAVSLQSTIKKTVILFKVDKVHLERSLFIPPFYIIPG